MMLAEIKKLAAAGKYEKLAKTFYVVSLNPDLDLYVQGEYRKVRLPEDDFKAFKYSQYGPDRVPMFKLDTKVGGRKLRIILTG